MKIEHIIFKIKKRNVRDYMYISCSIAIPAECNSDDEKTYHEMVRNMLLDLTNSTDIYLYLINTKKLTSLYDKYHDIIEELRNLGVKIVDF